MSASFFSASCDVADDELLGEDELALGVELLAPPLAEPEVLGCAALELELELGLLALGDAALEPPEADPDFAGSLELEALGDDALGDELELEDPGVDGEDDAPPVPPTDAEPDAEPDVPGVLELEPLGDDAVLELEEPGALEVRLESLLSHAARPNARATANASVESFMYFLRGLEQGTGVTSIQASNFRARPKPLMPNGLGRALGSLCARDGSSYLLPPGLPALPEPLGLLGPLEPPAPPGLVERLPAVLEEVSLELPLVPDALEPPEADPPLEGPPLSQPAISVPLRANASAAANAVNFMLTSIGLCAETGARNGPRDAIHESRTVHR